MKLMVIGGGGREHAIIKKLKENPAIEEIYCLPGKGGIAADAVCVPEIGAKDIPAQVEFAKAHRIDYAVVAPDDPLALGAVDALSEAGIPCFGPDKKAAVIGGGAGCAIAYPQAKALHAMGTKVDMIAGFRDKDLIILENEMREASDRLIVMTDDGSNGNKGFVTAALQKNIDEGADYDLVIAIGPIPMMKAVSNLTKPYGIKTIISMNTIMVDGTGMCGGCRLTVGGETKFACVDGPDFDGHLVDFDEAMKRLGTYKPEEAREREEHCRLYGGIK